MTTSGVPSNGITIWGLDLHPSKSSMAIAHKLSSRSQFPAVRDWRLLEIIFRKNRQPSIFQHKRPSVESPRKRVSFDTRFRSWVSLQAGTSIPRSAQSESYFTTSRIEEVAEVVQPSKEESRYAWLIDEVKTPYNHISVIELGPEADHKYAGAIVLMLDKKNLVHSVYWPDHRVWTDECFDEFTLLPPLVPPGPIAILGLGAGTVARLLLHAWPTRQLEGWELDPEVIRVGRAYFGLADLERSGEKDRHRPRRKKRTSPRPNLVVHVGDALREDARLEGRFAALIVDLYSHGRICEGLKESSTWVMLKKRLLPHGRIMANCGGPPVVKDVQEEDQWLTDTESTIDAMSTAFDGQINVKQLKKEGRNVLVLSGELPALEDWSVRLPAQLMKGLQDWQPLRENLKECLEATI